MEHAVSSDGHPEQDFRIVRLLAALEAIPDPVERAQECLRVGDQVRAIHGRLGEIRRRAVYEATLKPGATGRSVAQALGVSAKAVSQASSHFRQSDLATLDKAAGLLSETLGSTSPEIGHLLAVKASTRSVTLIAQALLSTYTTWITGLDPSSVDDDTYETVQDAYERAEYLCQLAQVAMAPAQRIRFQTLALAEPDYEAIPAELVWPMQVLNAMPGILAFGTNYDYDDGSEWSLCWNILPAERYTSVFDAGPDPKGWAVSEWLVWLARDFERAGKAVSSRVSSPPPFLNEPGESLSFLIEGAIGHESSITAVEFAEQIINTWDGTSPETRTGYFPIDWPQRPEASA
ncbi:hypothetical protein [Oerskovia enterophila]|uniref:hypothetical protein n=1 Tax=Oerskovia enterophila TaxID=43678 RepID=UPI0033959629